MRTRRSLSIIALAFAVCLLPLAARAAESKEGAEEMVDNPAYKSWSKSKPGTSVSLSGITKLAGTEMKSNIVFKLVSIDKDRAVVEMTSKLDTPGAPQQPPQKEELPAKVKKSEADGSKMPEGVKGSVKEKGKENIEVAGKKYQCKVFEFEGQLGEQKLTGKSWTSEEIPGMLVKSESTMKVQGMDVTSTTILTKIESK